ncbi:hypothetical protein [Kineococcus esterisolvens]|uniref:hypothetical protein n=1 Tax=unclassified Kineococcus TaxID=2621656 RepID=UPI003D7ED088
MRSVEELRQARARAVLDLLPVEQMPTWAAHALAYGHDSPALRELAGLDGADPRQVHDAFSTALDELGVPVLSEKQAHWQMAHAWAQAAVDGTLAPYEAARRIWRHACSPLGHPDALAAFAGLASEWEDAPAHRAACEADIVAAAHRLLASC